jgi:hypothetical protein
VYGLPNVPGTVRDRREELRRRVGSRNWHYLHDYACFRCRKSFKLPVGRPGSVCRQCRAPLVRLGRNFRRPARNDREQWEKVRLLAEAGYRFNGYSGDCRPRTLAEARRFLAEHGPAPGLRAGDASP